jgi:hypothetical protein
MPLPPRSRPVALPVPTMAATGRATAAVYMAIHSGPVSPPVFVNYLDYSRCLCEIASKPFKSAKGCASARPLTIPSREQKSARHPGPTVEAGIPATANPATRQARPSPTHRAARQPRCRRDRAVQQHGVATITAKGRCCFSGHLSHRAKLCLGNTRGSAASPPVPIARPICRASKGRY